MGARKVSVRERRPVARRHGPQHGRQSVIPNECPTASTPNRTTETGHGIQCPGGPARPIDYLYSLEKVWIRPSGGRCRRATAAADSGPAPGPRPHPGASSGTATYRPRRSWPLIERCPPPPCTQRGGYAPLPSEAAPVCFVFGVWVRGALFSKAYPRTNRPAGHFGCDIYYPDIIYILLEKLLSCGDIQPPSHICIPTYQISLVLLWCVDMHQSDRYPAGSARRFPALG